MSKLTLGSPSMHLLLLVAITMKAVSGQASARRRRRCLHASVTRCILPTEASVTG